MPFADAEHVTILRDSSNKEPAQKAIAAQYDVLLMLGDNLNDFQRRYYVDDVMQRNRLLDEDRKAFGEVRDLPQSTDGHWMKAIFGESEPADTPANRAPRCGEPGRLEAATETHGAPGKVRRQSSAAHSANVVPVRVPRYQHVLAASAGLPGRPGFALSPPSA